MAKKGVPRGRMTSREITQRFPWVKRGNVYRTRARQKGRGTLRHPTITKHMMDLQDATIIANRRGL